MQYISLIWDTVLLGMQIVLEVTCFNKKTCTACKILKKCLFKLLFDCLLNEKLCKYNVLTI